MSVVLSPDEQLLYDLATAYYARTLGCGNVLRNLFPNPVRTKLAHRLATVSGVTLEDTQTILAAVILITLSAKTFGDVMLKLKQAYQKGTDGHKSLPEMVGKVMRLATIAALSLWDTIHPDLPVSPDFLDPSV